MTKDEALKLALEALESIKYDPYVTPSAGLLTTLRAALAQQEAEAHLQAVSDFGLTYRDWRNQYTLGTISADHETITQAAYNAGWKDGYKRKAEWLGLSPSDFEKLEQLYGHQASNDFAFVNIVCQVEAKLKEKNHG